MAERWEETAEEIFKLSHRGEKAKFYVLQRVVGRLVPSAERNAFRKIVEECIKEGHEKINKGEFSKPDDWILFMSNWLSASDEFDLEGILQDPTNLSLSIIREILRGDIR